MISIDLIFLAVLINAGIGTVYMKWWAKYSKRLEKRSEYIKVYQLLRIAILFFALPGLLSALLAGQIWRVQILEIFKEEIPGSIALLILFAAALVWIAGMIWNTCKYFRDVHRFCQICEYNEEIEHEHLKEYFEQICKRQHIYKEVTIYTNSRIQVPVIFGVFKRTILLPESCSKPEELQIILEHEMIHAKHNDLLLERIAAIIYLVIWFIPEPKQLLDKLEEWSETICDISVCASQDSVWNKKQYFTLLLRWAQEEKTAGTGTVMALSGESSVIKDRI